MHSIVCAGHPPRECGGFSACRLGESHYGVQQGPGEDCSLGAGAVWPDGLLKGRWKLEEWSQIQHFIENAKSLRIRLAKEAL